MARATLLSVVESPAHPDFSSVYAKHGLDQARVNSMRKAISEAKRLKPAYVVGEFFYGYGNNYAGVNISNLDVLLYKSAEICTRCESDRAGREGRAALRRQAERDSAAARGAAVSGAREGYGGGARSPLAPEYGESLGIGPGFRLRSAQAMLIDTRSIGWRRTLWRLTGCQKKRPEGRFFLIPNRAGLS